MLKVHDQNRKFFRFEDVHTGMLVRDTGLVPTDRIVNVKKIYIGHPGHCGGRDCQYPLAVVRHGGGNYSYHSEFVQSSCSTIVRTCCFLLKHYCKLALTLFVVVVVVVIFLRPFVLRLIK